MKKIKTIHYLIGAIILALCGSCTSEKKENDLAEKKLKGNVKTVQRFFFDVKDKFGEIEKSNKRPGRFYRFNRDGNILVDTNSYYAYNYTYNDQGQLKEKVTYYDGLLEGKTLYEYDGQGNQITESQFDKDGSLIGKELSEYDEHGNNITDKIYNKFGDLETTWSYKYDDQNNQIEKMELYENITYKITKEYNAKNQLVNKKRYSGSDPDYKLESEESYKYDNRGNEISETHDRWSAEYKYDENDLMIHLKSATGVFTFKYILDEHGNWISTTEYLNSIPQSLTEREITYYE